MASHRVIAVLLLLFVLLATVYNAVVPLGEGPDEPGHMAYVLFLAREGHLPVQRAEMAESDVPGEGHQPPLAYVLALPAAAWLPTEAQHLNLSANPHFLWNEGSDPAAFMRASQEYWPWQGLTLAWHLARAVSTLLGALTVYCTWRAARTFFSTRPAFASHAGQASMLAAAVVAFNPQFLFTSALVTNDMLLTALSAGLFWLCIATTAAGATVGNRAIGNTSFGRPIVNRQLVIVNVLAGVLFGLALLTKQSALLLGPLLLWWGWTISGGNWRRVALHTALWLGTALLVAGWWYVRNWQLYGDLLGLADFRASYATQPFDWRSWSAWGSALAQLYGSFWARFGWLSLHPPAWVLWCSGVLVWLALAGGGHLLPPSSAGPLSPADEARGFRSLWTPMYMLPLLALAWVVSFALVAGLVAWQGRFLFPALPAIALLLAAGLTGFRVHRLDGRGWGVIPGLLFLLALYMPYGVIAPAYEWRVLPPVVAQQRIERPAYARYAKEWERGVELRGWRVSHAQENGLPNPIRPGEGVRAGQTISITLTWHALERVPPDRNWTVFLHLVDDAGEIVTEHNSIPQGGQMPMPLWTPGDWLEDTHPLVIPADLPAGAYTLRVGLYRPWQRDPRKGHRQEVWNAQGEHIGDYAEVGTLRVRQANP